MNKIAYLILIGSFAVACSQDSDNNTTSSQNQSSSETTVIWVGPGLYYGIYFATEAELLSWQREHIHYHYHYHYYAPPHGHPYYHNHPQAHPRVEQERR